MTLEPNTYPVPTSLKLRDIWRTTWAALPMLGIALAADVYLIIREGWGMEGLWTMHALILAVLCIIAWGAQWSWRHGRVEYDVEGLHLIFADPRYYFPPEVFREFLFREVWDKFRPHVPTDTSVDALTSGVMLLYESEVQARVREQDGQIRIKNVFGATQPWRRYSRIAAHRALDPGVGGYELMLHCCHYLFPGRSEADDIQWMKEKKII